MTRTTTRIPLLFALSALVVLTAGAAARNAGARPTATAAVTVHDSAPAWSPNGKTIAFSALSGSHTQIYTVNANGGGKRQLTHSTQDSIDLYWSPSGKQIAFSRVPSTQEIASGRVYIMNANGSGQRPLTTGGGGYDELLGFSPDGTMIAFDRVTNGQGAIYTESVTGGDLHELTPSADDDDYWGVWSPNGKQIAFDRTAPSAFGDIWTMNADGTDQKRLTANPDDNFGSAWSPNGKQIAFQSNRLNRYQIYVMPSSGGTQRRISHGGTSYDAGEVHWSPNGEQLVYEQEVSDPDTLYPPDEIFTASPSGGATRELTPITSGANTDPAWSPNGKKIAFLSTRDNGVDVYVMNADGSGQHKLS